MSKCINQNHPDFIELLNKTGRNKFILAADVSLWMDKNNSNNIPSMKDINLNYTLKSAPELYKKYNLLNKENNLKKLSFAAATKWVNKNNQNSNYLFKVSKINEKDYTIVIQDNYSNLNKNQENTIEKQIDDKELIKRQEEFKQLEDEANQTLNEEGDVVIKNEQKIEDENKILRGAIQEFLDESESNNTNADSRTSTEMVSSFSEYKFKPNFLSDNSIESISKYLSESEYTPFIISSFLSKNIGEIWKEKDTNQRELELYTFYKLFESLNGKFSRLGEKLSSEDFKSGFRIDFNNEIPGPILANSAGNIVVNLKEFVDNIKRYKNLSDYNKAIDAYLFEELIHLAQYKVFTKNDVDTIYNSLSKKEIDAIKKVYNDKNISNEALVYEYTRMIIQNNILGFHSESVITNPKSAVLQFINKLFSYILDVFNKKPQEIKDTIAKVENYINPNLRKNASKQDFLTYSKDFEGNTSFNSTFEVEKEIQNEYRERSFGNVRTKISKNSRIQFSEEFSSLDDKSAWENAIQKSDKDNLSFGELLSRSAGEIISNETSETISNALVSAMFIASRIQNKSDRFVGRLLDNIGETRKQKGRTGGNIIIYYNSDNKISFSAFKGNIEINAANILDEYKISGNFDNFIKQLEITLTEEIIHLITDEVATNQDLRNIANELPEDLANKIGTLYEGINSPEEGAAEYVRQVVQSRLFGTTTELESYLNTTISNPIVDKIINLFKKIVNYIKEAFQNNPTPEAKKIIDRIETYINQNTSQVKKGVNFVFEQNPELSSIGTPQQYSQYLNTIFPDSKVKDIVYHGSPIKNLQEIKRGDNNQGKMYTSRYGITFTNMEMSAAMYAGQIPDNPNEEPNWNNGQVYNVLLNLENFDTQDFENQPYGGKFGSSIGTYNNALEKAKKNGKDGFVATNIADPAQNQTNYVVFEPRQIFVLGSKKDIEKFKEFVNPKTNDKVEEHQNEVRKERTKEQVKESIQIVNDINESKDYYAEVIKINDNSHYIELFEKEELPEEYKRINVDKNLTSQELGSEQLNKVLWKMKQVFPDFSHQVINESKLQELLPNLSKEEILKTNAFIVDKTVYLVEGKFTPEMVAEEFLHPFILSITQDENKLNELYVEASKLYDLTNVFNQYSKIDENTAKREVITRALSFLVKEELTKEKESFLKKILNLIRKIFSKFNTSSTLESLASKISNEDIQLDYLTTDQPQFNIGIDIKDTFERFKQNPKENGLVKETVLVEGIPKEVYKNKEGKIIGRVSDLVQEYYKKIFRNKDDENTAEKNSIFEVWKDKGSGIHKDIENMIRFFIDSKTGLKLDDSQINTENFRDTSGVSESYKEEYKNILETYVRDLLDTYPKETRFLLENMFINTKGKNPIASTMDFIAITPDGIDILDWKTIYKLKDDKIPTYKKGAWKVQLEAYKKVLKQEFQLSDSDFRYSRIIPILPIVSTNPMNPEIEKISIGKVKTKEETNLNLLPFLSDSDSLYKSGIGDFINKLIAVINKQEDIESKKLGYNVKDYILESELEEAVQIAVLQNKYTKLLNFIIHIEKKSKDTLDEINNKLKDGNSLTDEETKYYSSLIRNLSETVKGLKGFFEYSQKELDEESRKAHATDIGRITNSIFTFETQVKDINKLIVSNIGEREGFLNITAPEKITSWWDANFKRFSRGPTKSVKLLQSLLRPVFSKITIQRKDAVLKGQSIANNLMNWGQRNNKTQQEIFDMFLTSDKRTSQPKLVEKINPSFYEKRNEAKENKEKALKFIKDNYDLEAFNKKKEEYLKGQFAKIDGYVKTEEEKQKLKLKETNNLDINFNPKYVLTNPLLNQFLKEELWYSNFFKMINQKGNEELLSFWNYMTNVISRAKDTGISSDITNRFVPQKLKDIYEVEVKQIWSKYIEGLKISPDQYEFGAINPITGLQEDKLYLNFTRDLGEKIEGESFKKDYSNVSRDLLRSFMLFDYDLIEKENIQAAEDFSEVLSDFEAANKVINVTKLGGILKYFKNGVTEVSQIEQGKDGYNAKVYDSFKKLYIYNQQIQDYTDFALKVGKDEYISGIKTIKKVVQTARSSAFALNVMSPLRNLVLGKINTWINTNPYFSYSANASSNLHLADDIFINLDSLKDRKFVSLLEFILPLSTDNFQKELNKASLKSGLRKFSIDNLQILMKNSDDVVQIHIFKELLKNSTVRDGKIVNINIWVKEENKKKNNYSEFYKLSLEDRNKYQKEINEEVQRLKKEDDIYNYVSVKDDKIEIKGVDRNDESVMHIRELTRQYSAEATGSLSEEDQSLSSTSFIMQMMSMYRSWIAPTVGVRAGKFDYTQQGITEGRMRSMVKYLGDETEKKSKKVKNLLMGATFGIFDKESLIKVAKDLRRKKINEMKESGKYIKEISEDEFVEMYLRNLDSAFKDLRATFTLFALVSLGLASSLMGGGSDDDKKTNLQKIVERELKKYNNELTFYYNPLEALSIIKNPFPVTTYIDNYLKVITNTVGEPFNPDKNHPLKYVLRSFPVTNMVATYLPIMDDETAKELGIKLTTNYGIR